MANLRTNVGVLESGCDDTASPNLKRAKELLDFIMRSEMPPLKVYERECLSEYLGSQEVWSYDI